MKTFKILGLLLSYPSEELITHLDDLMCVLEKENLLPARSMKKVKALSAHMQATDFYALQEDYVELFDRGRAHCLQLFEHIHGESRDRGMAMVNLAEAYAEKGLFVSSGQLPDFLPLFLEFLSLCPVEDALDLLGDPITVIVTIGVKLKKRKSLYAGIFESLEALSKVKADADMVAKVLSEPLEVMTLEDIDKDWEDASAFDNSDMSEGDCSSCNAFPQATEEIQKFNSQNMNGGQ